MSAAQVGWTSAPPREHRLPPTSPTLRRIEQDPALSASLVRPGDFDIDRRDLMDDLVLPTGAALHPIAGGTYYPCGEAGTEERPVLYADSESRATLIGADLVEAVTLIVVLPFWRDLASDFTTS
ncbi:hypothetical protein [Streptomyces sp. NPDC058297]|uniref:hypothetical protein n=1 Tax=Streptomyces sp. NPDC058297 TaxID=3346433 RepID=UPI0036E16D40